MGGANSAPLMYKWVGLFDDSLPSSECHGTRVAKSKWNSLLSKWYRSVEYCADELYPKEMNVSTALGMLAAPFAMLPKVASAFVVSALLGVVLTTSALRRREVS